MDIANLTQIDTIFTPYKYIKKISNRADHIILHKSNTGVRFCLRLFVGMIAVSIFRSNEYKWTRTCILYV